jgi:glycosyltransferase involved in cell wall biosynthesis
MGVKSHVLCGVVVGDLPAEVDSTHVIPGLADRRLLPGTAEQVAQAIDALSPDIVYLHNLFDACIVETLDRAERRAKLIWYIHDHYPTCLTELRLRSGRPCSELLGVSCVEAVREGHCTRRLAGLPLEDTELAERRSLLAACRRVDAVVVVSPYMRDLLTAHLPDLADRIHLLPRPIRPGIPGRARRSPNHGPLTITFAGRITPEKGLDVVLRALTQLPGDLSVRMNVAGIVEHREYWAHCQDLADKATATNPNLSVSVLGHLAYAEIDELFAASDVVAIPSRWPEPLGAVAAEALRAGAAVVASRVGGLGTYITEGETGLLVAPGDADGWTAALVALARQPAWARQLGEAGARSVAHLTAEHHVEALDELLRRLDPAIG